MATNGRNHDGENQISAPGLKPENQVYKMNPTDINYIQHTTSEKSSKLLYSKATLNEILKNLEILLSERRNIDQERILLELSVIQSHIENMLNSDRSIIKKLKPVRGTFVTVKCVGNYGPYAYLRRSDGKYLKYLGKVENKEGTYSSVDSIRFSKAKMKHV